MINRCKGVEFGYSEITKILKISNPINHYGLRFKKDGVYVLPPPVDLDPAERAELAYHPSGNLKVAVLSFPCTFDQFEKFVDDHGFRGTFDPFVFAEIVDKQSRRPRPDPESLDSSVSTDLMLLIEAQNQFWGSVERGEKAMYPINREVEAWLVKKGLSPNRAKAGASVIRPDYAK